MKVALVGVGTAGGRIVNRILECERRTGRDFCDDGALVFNTAPNEFDSPCRIPADRQVLLGDTHREVRGAGVDGDVDLGVEIGQHDANEIRRALDEVEAYEVDAILLAAGLGGGTGGGTGPVVLDELQTAYEKPVYVLGVLPATDEGGRRALNAARSLQSFVSTADNVILFDNDAWHADEEDAEGYERTNRELARRVVALFAAGERDGGAVAENRIDSSDVIRTLDTGGVSSIGYASIAVEDRGGGLLAWLRRLWKGEEDEDGDEGTTDAMRVQRLVRRAVDSRLTLPCEVSSAERVAFVLSGPPDELSRRGFESARYWLEEVADTVEVLAGDEPDERSSELRAVMLFSNVTDVPRIDALQDRAVAFRREADEEESEDDAFVFDRA